VCRLLGWVSDRPSTLAELLPRDALEAFTQLSQIHADGWGLAWLDDDDHLQRTREPKAAHSSKAYWQAVSRVRTRAAILHLRWATLGLPVSLENTHPFVRDGRAFAHNGAIHPLDGMGDLLTPEQRDALEGDTDSERYFSLLSESVGDLGRLAGVRRTIELVDQRLKASSLNAMLLTRTDLTTISCHDPTAGPSAGEPGADDEDGYFQLFVRDDREVTMVASSAWGRRGWDRLPNGVVVRVDIPSRALQTDLIGSAASGAPCG
jgi:predicted glutamine amidotransferase